MITDLKLSIAQAPADFQAPSDMRNPDGLRGQGSKLRCCRLSFFAPHDYDIVASLFFLILALPEELEGMMKDYINVLAELNGAERRGKALTTLAGRLIDNPHHATAERILRCNRKHQPSRPGML